MFENIAREKHGNIRLLEKQLRPEVVERTLQFLDVIINQIIYQENIYHQILFDRNQFCKTIVYLSNDKHISGYISLCVASLRDLLIHQLVDLISINIHSNENKKCSPILRRYLIEFHPIDDPCLRAIYDNTKDLIHHLDQVFSQTIRSIQQIKPLSSTSQKYSKKWTFQMRLSSESKTKNLTEIFKEKAIYKEFLLVNEESQLLSNGNDSIISQIKSFHCERLHLQIMCEDDQYEQKLFQQTTKSNNQDEDTDYEYDSDQNLTINEQTNENLLDRYHLREVNGDQIDILQYSSSSDDNHHLDDEFSSNSIHPTRSQLNDEEDNTDEEDF